MKNLLLAAAWIWAATSALAQPADYPSKPVRLIAPYAAGTGGDVVARMLAEGMARQLKQSVFVDNRSGASGTIGTQAVATAPADGYTIGLGGMTTHTLGPSIYPKLPYDPVKDFVTLGRVGVSSIVLLATKEFPANNLKELIALVKAKPEPQQYASWGVGSSGHFCGEVLNQRAGLTMSHISFAAKVIPSLLGGHIQLAFIDMASATPVVQDGRLKALAVCTQRSPSLPQVGSYKEQGVDFDQTLTWAMYAPAGTPAPLVHKLSAALRAMLDDPEIIRKMLVLGITAQYLSGPEQAAVNARDIPVWRKIAQDADIRID